MTLSWPLVRPEALTQGKPILVIAPHPDDETLGCGCLLASAFRGAGAHVLCLTDGSASHPKSPRWPPRDIAKLRKRELEQAVSHLGGKPADITWLGATDGRLHMQSALEIADHICALARRLGVASVFSAAAEDAHADHKAAARIAGLIARMCPDLSVYAYPVWSRWDEPEFEALVDGHAPVTLDPAAGADRKARALRAHASQLGEVIDDDPEGFVMEDGFVDRFLSEPEIFWRVHR